MMTANLWQWKQEIVNNYLTKNCLQNWKVLSTYLRVVLNQEKKLSDYVSTNIQQLPDQPGMAVRLMGCTE
jgi:hypothetical protein